jgi:hypothetical protein
MFTDFMICFFYFNFYIILQYPSRVNIRLLLISCKLSSLYRPHDANVFEFFFNYNTVLTLAYMIVVFIYLIEALILELT